MTLQESTESASAQEKVQISDRNSGILGVKAGMTQVYTESGELLAVTVIDLKSNVITQVKTPETDGYKAIQVGVINKKAKAANRAEAGHAKKVGAEGFYRLHEFRLSDKTSLEGITAGCLISPDFLKAGDLVDLSARCKGKGFQGGMKRFHMHGGNKSHGASVNHRSLGSIGMRADPGRVFKGKKMPGQMGNVNTTVQNVRVVRVDAENGLLLVHGSVPGAKSGLVTIRKAVKAAG